MTELFNNHDAFNAVQRANAVLTIILDNCACLIEDQNVINALFSVQGEIDSAERILAGSIWGKDDSATDKPQEFTEVERWADNHLQAAGNLYRLFDNATKAMLVEFEAESLADAKAKAATFLSDTIKKGGCAMNWYIRFKLCMAVFRVRAAIMRRYSHTQPKIIRRLSLAAFEVVTAFYIFMRWTWATH
ncbi:hypothetical protein QZJ86_04325 [Methylomonas montana]|uniref:hypothetical protein n=1 Tax=Methylomonas montana TaxID=3058963 RepID=UPI0026594AEC|nr:hypothetical protein [Methylomonas montana]WKJ91362.1 hypothetical protein QZJ86_04325 [Methylomonas montana]